MNVGIAVFPAHFAMPPDDLARAVEQRGFESVFFTEHTHVPATSGTRALIADALSDEEIPPYAHTYDLFVSLALAAAATSSLRLATGWFPSVMS
jgi:alkanesulfonate monooxygenase SsuD/methylene tetrahydromethanopterin reductase-like flavin-dependent oxidoreductase (luciferase family)